MSTQQPQQQQQPQQPDPEQEVPAKTMQAQPRRGLFSSLQRRFKSFRMTDEEEEYEKLFEDIPRPTKPPPMPPKEVLEVLATAKEIANNKFLGVINTRPVLAYICLNYLEPKDIFNLICVNKITRNSVYECAEVWVNLSEKYLPEHMISEMVPATNKDFMTAYNNMKNQKRESEKAEATDASGTSIKEDELMKGTNTKDEIETCEAPTPEPESNTHKEDSETGKSGNVIGSNEQANDEPAKSEPDKNLPNERCPSMILGGSPVSSNMDFQALLDRPESKEMKGMIEIFIKNFEKNTRGNISEEVKVTRNLLIATENTMKQHPLWEKLPENHFVVAKEEMYKYIFSKLYPIIFWKKEYKSKDKHIYEHIKELSPYMTPEFLDIKQDLINNDIVEASISELSTIDSFVTPFEKMMCIFNSCRVLICK